MALRRINSFNEQYQLMVQAEWEQVTAEKLMKYFPQTARYLQLFEAHDYFASERVQQAKTLLEELHRLLLRAAGKTNTLAIGRCVDGIKARLEQLEPYAKDRLAVYDNLIEQATEYIRRLQAVNVEIESLADQSRDVTGLHRMADEISTHINVALQLADRLGFEFAQIELDAATKNLVDLELYTASFDSLLEQEQAKLVKLLAALDAMNRQLSRINLSALSLSQRHHKKRDLLEDARRRIEQLRFAAEPLATTAVGMTCNPVLLARAVEQLTTTEQAARCSVHRAVIALELAHVDLLALKRHGALAGKLVDIIVGAYQQDPLRFSMAQALGLPELRAQTVSQRNDSPLLPVDLPKEAVVSMEDSLWARLTDLMSRLDPNQDEAHTARSIKRTYACDRLNTAVKQLEIIQQTCDGATYPFMEGVATSLLTGRSVVITDDTPAEDILVDARLLEKRIREVLTLLKC